ncbi:family transcriptional regulator, putative [Babesia ovata]|uniref:Family transcriptional regulator, putative n=1 Tax=Babesia ovata TaxID=189622 RepID=A0A2H6KIG0_9APIC|nr:family transcriptional regulator, putative [Babesia ovata]GBE62782.1 family transcriptional regulator, putative [Babesia ovata]
MQLLNVLPDFLKALQIFVAIDFLTCPVTLSKPLPQVTQVLLDAIIVQTFVTVGLTVLAFIHEPRDGFEFFFDVGDVVADFTFLWIDILVFELVLETVDRLERLQRLGNVCKQLLILAVYFSCPLSISLRFISLHDFINYKFTIALHPLVDFRLNLLDFLQNFIGALASRALSGRISSCIVRILQILVQRPSYTNHRIQFLCDASVAAHLCTAAEKYRFQFVAHLPHCRGERAHYQFRGGFFATLSIFAFCALCVALADAIFNIGDEPSHVQRLFLYIVDCFSFSSIKLFIQRRGKSIAKPLDSLNTFSDTAADDINTFERLFGCNCNVIAKPLFHFNRELLYIAVSTLIILLLHAEYPPHGAVVPQDCGFQPALGNFCKIIVAKSLRIFLHSSDNAIQTTWSFATPTTCVTPLNALHLPLNLQKHFTNMLFHTVHNILLQPPQIIFHAGFQIFNGLSNFTY